MTRSADIVVLVAGLYLALGWSRHGFKLTPAAGEVVADEIVGETPGIDVSALAPDGSAAGSCSGSPTAPGREPDPPARLGWAVKDSNLRPWD